MAEHREKVDRRMSLEVVKRVIVPLCMDLGARYLVRPYLGRYSDEDKTIKWGLGHKKHGDKRHRTHATFTGIVYRDGERTEGATRSQSRLTGASAGQAASTTTGWWRTRKTSTSRSRRTMRRTTRSAPSPVARSDPALQRDRAKGEVLGIGGSVQSSTEVHAHTEVETEKWGRTKQEMVLEDQVRIAYPGPIRDADGRVVEPGNIWLIERPVATLHTITPITQHGLVGLCGDRAGP